MREYEIITSKRKCEAFFPLIFLFACFTCNGCETQPLVSEKDKAMYQAYMDQRKENYYFESVLRVSRVGYPLLAAIPEEDRIRNVPRLPFVVLETGRYFRDLLSHKTDFGVVVLGEISKALVRSTQVQRGDLLMALDGKTISSEEDLRSWQNQWSGQKTTQATFQRNGREWTEEIPILVIGWDAYFVVDPRVSGINAYASPGGVIAVSSAMLRLAETDDELAFVLGHEIAHHLKNHLPRASVQQTIGLLSALAVAGVTDHYAKGTGALAGSLTGSAIIAPFSQEMEHEADEAGLAYMTKAGYSPEASLQLLRKMTIEMPGTQAQSFLRAHPSSAKRIEKLNLLVAKTAS